MGIWLALAGSGLMAIGAVLGLRAHLARGRRRALSQVAVIGPGDEPTDAAAEVGRLLAERGARAGLRRPGRGDGGGLPRRQGGRRADRRAPAGLGSRPQANPFVDVALPTGLGEARNALVVRAADAVIAVGGGYGTLSEIALALQGGQAR